MKLRALFKHFLHAIVEEFKETPGRPFIITFMILLVSAAVFLAAGDENIANKLAEYAYYSLVVGVVLQIVAIVRASRRSTTSQGSMK